MTFNALDGRSPVSDDDFAEMTPVLTDKLLDGMYPQ
jgi:hypothetical protein